ncbi:MAG: hypothetical protein ABIP75_11485 [Pyrinomonadaceae bacterium]
MNDRIVEILLEDIGVSGGQKAVNKDQQKSATGDNSRDVHQWQNGDRARLRWIDEMLEDPAMWRPRRRGKPLDRRAPDPPWMVRAVKVLEGPERDGIVVNPKAWAGHRFQPYAPFVFHLGRAVSRELGLAGEISGEVSPAVEFRVFYPRKRDNWSFRIQAHYDRARAFIIEGLVDPGDFKTPPFFREITVSFITKAFLPGALREQNGELEADADWCIVLNEWPTREAGRAPLTRDKEPPGDPAAPTLLDLLHKFIPAPHWWRGYCSPFKIPYSLWYKREPLPEWAERRLYHGRSVAWPWLPDSAIRERVAVWAARKWRNRRGYWKDGVDRRVTRPSQTDARDEHGRWQGQYSPSAKKLHRRKKRWDPRPVAPKRRGTATDLPFYLTDAGLRQPGPWPRWKVRRVLKQPPRPGRPRARDINQVWCRYLRAMPSLEIAPLRARARRYRVQARLIPLGENIHLAELFAFDAELQRALKHYSRRWCQMPKTDRVARRDQVREANGRSESGAKTPLTDG